MDRLKGKGGNDIALKLKFELQRKYQEQLHSMELIKILRAKILALKSDGDMTDEQIQNVKDSLMPLIIV